MYNLRMTAVHLAANVSARQSTAAVPRWQSSVDSSRSLQLGESLSPLVLFPIRSSLSSYSLSFESHRRFAQAEPSTARHLRGKKLMLCSCRKLVAARVSRTSLLLFTSSRVKAAGKVVLHGRYSLPYCCTMAMLRSPTYPWMASECHIPRSSRNVSMARNPLHRCGLKTCTVPSISELDPYRRTEYGVDIEY
jgi:hypothetical protein